MYYIDKKESRYDWSKYCFGLKEWKTFSFINRNGNPPTYDNLSSGVGEDKKKPFQKIISLLFK